MDLKLAQDIARRYLDGHIRPLIAVPVAIDYSRTVETDEHFAFFYNTEEFLRGGSPLVALAGNGPIVVRRTDGSVLVAGTSSPWQEQVGE